MGSDAAGDPVLGSRLSTPANRLSACDCASSGFTACNHGTQRGTATRRGRATLAPSLKTPPSRPPCRAQRSFLHGRNHLRHCKILAPRAEVPVGRHVNSLECQTCLSTYAEAKSVFGAVANRSQEPPPIDANAALLGERGGAANKKIRKAQRSGYRPLQCLSQVGGAL